MKFEFDAKTVVELAEYSKTNGHAYGIRWIKDHGVYVMSLAPNPVDPNSDEEYKKQHVCYARGFNPSIDDFDAWYDRAASGLGGDDFVEYLKFDEQFMAKLRSAANDPKLDVVFILKANRRSFSYGFNSVRKADPRIKKGSACIIKAPSATHPLHDALCRVESKGSKNAKVRILDENYEAKFSLCHQVPLSRLQFVSQPKWKNGKVVGHEVAAS